MISEILPHSVLICDEKKIRNWSVKSTPNSTLKFIPNENWTKLRMEQIIANLMVADNAILQKVNFILNEYKKYNKMYRFFFTLNIILLIEIYIKINDSVTPWSTWSTEFYYEFDSIPFRWVILWSIGSFYFTRNNFIENCRNFFLYRLQKNKDSYFIYCILLYSYYDKFSRQNPFTAVLSVNYVCAHIQFKLTLHVIRSNEIVLFFDAIKIIS